MRLGDGRIVHRRARYVDGETRNGLIKKRRKGRDSARRASPFYNAVGECLLEFAQVKPLSNGCGNARGTILELPRTRYPKIAENDRKIISCGNDGRICRRPKGLASRANGNTIPILPNDGILRIGVFTATHGDNARCNNPQYSRFFHDLPRVHDSG